MDLCVCVFIYARVHACVCCSGNMSISISIILTCFSNLLTHVRVIVSHSLHMCLHPSLKQSCHWRAWNNPSRTRTLSRGCAHTHTPPRARAQVQIRAPAFSCVKKRCAVNPDCCRASLSPLFSPSFCAAPLYCSLSSHLSSLKRSDIAVSRLFRLALFFSFSTLLLKERICHLSASLHFLSLPRRS